MRGDLSDITVPAICGSLALEGVTGRLLVSGPQGPGTVTLRQGMITDASSPLPRARLRERLTGGGHVDELTMARVVHELRETSPDGSTGTPLDDGSIAAGLLERQLASRQLIDRLLVTPVVDALVELTARREGDYHVEVSGSAEGGVTEGTVHLTVEAAFVAVARRSDELVTLPAVTRSPDTVPLLLLDLPANPADFDADTLTVLDAIDDHSNLGEIARRIGYGFFDVARVVARLYGRGVVALTDPPAEDTTRAGVILDPVQAAARRTNGLSHSELSSLPVDHAQSGGPEDDPDGMADPLPTRTPAVPTPPPAASHPAAAADPAATAGPAASGEPRAADEQAATEDSAPAGDPAATAGPAATEQPVVASGSPRPHPSSSADDTDVSEFLRELSSLANRDDTRTRRPHAPSPAERGGRGDPHEARPAGSGHGSPAPTDHDAERERPDDHRNAGSSSPSDDARRKRRGFFGRG